MTLTSNFIILLAFCLLCCSCGGGGNNVVQGDALTQSTPSPAAINAASCSYASVSSAISSATAGDTINVPAGSCTWSRGLSITKGINLIGAGIGKTVIINNYTGSYLLRYNPSNYSLNTPFRLSGFTFNMAAKAGWLMLGNWGREHYAPFTIQTKIRVDHNRVYNPKSVSAGIIWDTGGFYGVVDNNSFEGSKYPIKHDPGISEASGWYSTSPQNIFVSGSSNYLYFEDNFFILDVQGGEDSIMNDCEVGGRYVYRYNTITGLYNAWSTLDVHGNQGNMPACFGAEVYGNKFTCSGGGTFFYSRAGRSFAFNNSAVGSGSNDVNCNKHHYSTSGPTICPSTYAAEQMIHDTYTWGNRQGTTGIVSTYYTEGTISCDGHTRPTFGVDMFYESSSPGVSCGTLANLPATCTTGQGYWATNQSCTNLTGMVGKAPSTPISGTLYKCTSTNTWTAFYTPYTYPHPLR